jgi:hypothetical protein
VKHCSKRLLDRVRDAIRLNISSVRTEEAYVDWIKHFILFHDKRPSSRDGLLGRQSLSLSPGDEGRRCCFHSESGAQRNLGEERQTSSHCVGPATRTRSGQQEALAVISSTLLWTRFVSNSLSSTWSPWPRPSSTSNRVSFREIAAAVEVIFCN